MNRYHLDNDPVLSNQIFVFNSNLAGRHSDGHADFAYRNFGAIYGVGKGPMNQCYALPTKGMLLKTLPLSEIKEHVKDFLWYTDTHVHDEFYLTRVGCGLAGYQNWQIAPMFEGYRPNIIFPNDWMKWIEGRY